MVVEDRSDLYGWILDRRDHHPQVVGVQVGVTTRQSLGAVGEAVLAGLGKDPWLSVSKRPAELLAGAWLTAGAATDVIIGYAQTLSPWLLPEVITWFVGLGVRPWLVFTTFDNDAEIRAQATTIAADWGVPVGDRVALDDAWPDAPSFTSPETAARPSGLGVLPRTDGIRFRSSCRDLLNPDAFAHFDQMFVSAVTDLRTAIAGLRPKHKARQFAQILRDRLDTARDTEELILWARAAQVAGVGAGFHVKVDTTTLVGAAEALPRSGLADPQGWWDRLDRYRDPDPGAAAALYTSGIDPADLTRLQLRHIDGTTVDVGDETHTVTAGAGFVEALVAFRRLAGAGEDDLLFATHRKESVTHKHIAGLIWGHSNDTGVRVAPQPAIRSHPPAMSWLTRYGVTISMPRSVAAGTR